MTKASDVVIELADRIHAEREHFGGEMPELTAACWRGYLAAMLEWNLVSVEEYERLVARVPEVAGDPAVAILAGRD